MSISNHEGENDSELLWWAAKAIGVHIAQGSRIAIDGKLWNPLEDDGDALRLAVKLEMGLVISASHGPSARAQSADGPWRDEEVGGDLGAATRRAIVRAAAEIGRRMP